MCQSPGALWQLMRSGWGGVLVGASEICELTVAEENRILDVSNLSEGILLVAVADKSKKKRRVPMQVPESFHELVSAEADRQGISMRALLALYGDRMIAAAKPTAIKGWFTGQTWNPWDKARRTKKRNPRNEHSWNLTQPHFHS